jgi:dipeptidyl aminopeptidase/acylaminoacyl peptidase
MPDGLRLDDLERLILVSDPRWSTLGWLAFVRSWLDTAADAARRDIALTDPAGAVERLPLGEANAWCPRWSTDGTQLAAITTAAGSAQAAIWPIGSRAMRALSPVPGEVVDLDWSPDGRFLAVTSLIREALDQRPAVLHPVGSGRLDGSPGLVREVRRVFVLPADGAAGREIAADVADDTWHPRWSPDGASLAFLASSPAGLQASGGTQLCVATEYATPGTGILRVASRAVAFTWSPYGTELAYLAPREHDFPDVECRLYRCKASGTGPSVEIAAGWDRSLGSTVRGDDSRGAAPCAPLWSAATGRIYFSVADGGQGAIGWASPDSGDYGVLLNGRRCCLEPSLSPDGLGIVFVSTDPGDPGTVCTLNLDTGAERRLPGVNTWLDHGLSTRTKQVSVLRDDGVRLEAWLTLPGDSEANPLPLVVSIHGGPHYPIGWRFSFEAQRLAARGYAVMAPNPSGSGGYGRDFATSIRGRWGTLDWEDVCSLVDAAATDHAIDGNRVGVTGVSYGGFLSLHAITVSDRLRTAISENGVSNLLALWGSGAEDPDWLTAEMGGTPWEQVGSYVRASPLTSAARISVPLLLIHAELDQNCPISQSEQMLAAIRRCGGEAQLLRLDGEGHLVNLIGRPSQRFARARAVDGWLDRYLSPSAPKRDAHADRAESDRSNHGGRT